MRLTPGVVGDVLEATLGHRVAMNPHGFELRSSAGRRARLRCGSGIAGRGDVWGLVRMPDGAPITMGIDTRRELSRAVLAFVSDSPPAHPPEHTGARAKRVVHPRAAAAHLEDRGPKRPTR